MHTTVSVCVAQPWWKWNFRKKITFLQIGCIYVCIMCGGEADAQSVLLLCYKEHFPYCCDCSHIDSTIILICCCGCKGGQPRMEGSLYMGKENKAIMVRSGMIKGSLGAQSVSVCLSPGANKSFCLFVQQYPLLFLNEQVCSHTHVMAIRNCC